MYLGHLGKSRKLGTNGTNLGHVYTESHSKCSTADFASNETLLKCKGRVRVIPVLMHLDITASHGNWIEKPQIKGTNIQIVIQSVKLHISRQMTPCSGAKTV